MEERELESGQFFLLSTFYFSHDVHDVIRKYKKLVKK